MANIFKDRIRKDLCEISANFVNALHPECGLCIWPKCLSTLFWSWIKLQAVLKEWKKMTRFLWNWTLSLPIYLLSLWLSMTTTPNLKTLHAIYLDSNLNILIKDSIFFRPILSTPFPWSKIVFIFNTVFSFPLCDLLLDADNDLYLNKKKWFVPSFVDIYII